MYVCMYILLLFDEFWMKLFLSRVQWSSMRILDCKISMT